MNMDNANLAQRLITQARKAAELIKDEISSQFYNKLCSTIIMCQDYVEGETDLSWVMLMGFYNPVLNTIKDFFTALAAFDMDGILKGCGVLIPFGLGVVAGMFGIAKLVEIIFEKFPLYAYWAIIGLIVSSPIAILLMGSFPAVTVLSAVTGVLCLAVGIGIAMKLGE